MAYVMSDQDVKGMHESIWQTVFSTTFQVPNNHFQFFIWILLLINSSQTVIWQTSSFICTDKSINNWLKVTDSESLSAV